MTAGIRQGRIRDKKLLAKVVPGCDWCFIRPPVVCATLRGHALGKQRSQSGRHAQPVGDRTRCRVKRFLFASSRGGLRRQRTDAQTRRIAANPLSPYALQNMQEKYAQLFTAFTVLRPSLALLHIFGPVSITSPYSGSLQSSAPECCGRSAGDFGACHSCATSLSSAM